MNNFKEEMDLLLNNFWISKKDNKESYYKVKNKLSFLREISNKLGCDIICNNKIIKLEKIPYTIDKTYNIYEFDEKLDYVLFVCILLFLQDKGLDEQFILSNLTAYITNILATIDGDNKPDWTKYRHRKSLTDVLKYAKDIGIIRLRDGNDLSYADNEMADALFENTTLCHYVIRNFKFDVFSCFKAQDFIEKEKSTIDEKEYKKIISYRALFYYPHVYLPKVSDDSKNYIKNIRHNIGRDVSKYLDGELIIARDLALICQEDNRKSESFPDLNKSITDIVLLVCSKLRALDLNTTIPIERFNMILENIYKEYKDYFSKKYRDLPLKKFDEEITEYMESFKLISIVDNKILIYPVCYFYEGYYKEKEVFHENYKFLTLDLEEQYE